jgi:LPXTG-site transpeptidase (sortase) family protein
MVVGLAIVFGVGAILVIVPATVAKVDSPLVDDSTNIPDLYQAEAVATKKVRALPTLAILPESFPMPQTSDSDEKGNNQQDLPSFASLLDAPKDLDLTGPEQPIHLVIPALDVDASIERVGLKSVSKEGNAYLQWQVPNGYAIGWHESSATLGHTGNTVLNGHNNIYGSVFKDLIELEPGDEINVHDRESIHEYRVVEKKVLPENGQPPSVRLANARWIGPSGDERITLVSCWPFTSNKNRIIVVARPVQNG